MNILLLGSKSQARQQLLKETMIPFKTVSQDADEQKCDWNLPLEEVVESIALYKMEQVILPAGKEGDFCFVLTADTLSVDIDGTIQGKPIDREDALAKIRAARKGTKLATAFCLDKKIYKAGIWEVEKRIVRVVTSRFRFDIPEEWLERYLQNSAGFVSSNAIAIEGYGNLFLKDIDGSYSK